MITLIIIGITALISFVCFSNHELRYKLMHIPSLIERKGEYYRLLTSGFIHADGQHLIVNMLSLFFFGSTLERFFSSGDMFGNKWSAIIFLIFYLTAVIAANAPIFSKNRNNSSYAGLGASGATAAVLFAYILFEPLNKIYLYGIIGIPAWIFGILYLAYESYADKNVNDNVAHDVHFFGALYGLLFVSVFNPDVPKYCIQQILSIF